MALLERGAAFTGLASFPEGEEAFRSWDIPQIDFDPELLYVECQRCGNPVLWEEGKTTTLLVASGVDLGMLDAHCLILADSCQKCMPSAAEGYTLSVVRVAGLTPEEAEYMTKPAGHC